MNIANVGGTLTGGATVALTSSGLSSGGKSSFITPTHTRLEPQTVDFYVTQATTTAKDPGVARSGLKVSFASRSEPAEGCCTVTAGSIIFDVSARWSLSQPEALVDDAFELLQAILFNPATLASLKVGSLPTS